MRQSQLFTKISREAPKDEVSFNAQILIKAGFIDKAGAGIYTFLPLGLRVLEKICRIIREEMNAIGGQEILMPGLTPKEVWQKTGRWEIFDALFKLKGADEKEYALGATHEEIVTPLVKKHIFSYRELPLYVYQVQTKYRNEKRAKAGLLRGREFVMKDLYSFHADAEDLDRYYEEAKKSYFRIFDRLGLLDVTYLTFASGGAFSRYSHEFQALSPNGEDFIYICDECKVAVNNEIIDEQKVCPDCGRKNFRREKAIEVGNIFKLGARFSGAFDFFYTDKKGGKKEVVMGCYGLGPSRAMGAIADIHHDEKGLIWPEETAPFKIHLLEILPSAGTESEAVRQKAGQIFKELTRAGWEVLYDDRRGASAGEKFAEADLIGCPFRLVVSAKTCRQERVEIKRRHSDSCELVKIDKIPAWFGAKKLEKIDVK